MTVKTECLFTAGPLSFALAPPQKWHFKSWAHGFWVGAQRQLYRLILRFVPIGALRNFGSHRARNLVSHPPKIPVKYLHMGFLVVICYMCTFSHREKPVFITGRDFSRDGLIRPYVYYRLILDYVSRGWIKSHYFSGFPIKLVHRS